MIIHEPELLTHDDHTILFSRIEMENKAAGLPDFLWYRTPSQYAPFFSLHSDPFVIPGLLAGMHFKEEIHVRGCVSPKLAYHLEEYQYLLHFRMPEAVSPVQVHYDRLAPLNANPIAVGSTFSGGVDSLFTIWKHLPQNQPVPGYHISHAIFIRGFDLLPEEDLHYQKLLNIYRNSAAGINLVIIPMETNVVSLTHHRLDLPHFYGPIIISAAMALAGGLRIFYIPSSWDYKKLRQKEYASDPLIDRMLSTETLEIINHGSTHRRVDKIKEISNWEVAHETLWVCETHEFLNDTWNCSRCEKCLRTMIPIYALGKMDKFKTFSIPITSDREGLRWARKFTTKRIFNHEIFDFVKEQDPVFLVWLRLAAFLGTLRWFLISSLPQFIKKWLRRFGYFINRNEAQEAYEVPEITRLVQKTHDHP